MIPPPTPSAGSAPTNAYEFNLQLGTLLRGFINSKNSVNQWHEWLGGVDLKEDPYNFTASDEALVKSAINDLDTSLDGLDMTFINRLAGPF